MIGKLTIFLSCLFLLGALLTYAAQTLNRVDSKRRHQDWVKYLVYLSLVLLFILTLVTDERVTLVLLVLIAAIGALEIYRCINYPRRKRICLSAAAFVLLLACLIQPLVAFRQGWNASFCFLFLVVCATDSFSQLWGRLLGRHRLSKLSPNKTCEGLIGGATTALCCAAALSFLLPHLDAAGVMLLGLIVVSAAVVGDLFFSLIKRRLVIKDFSAMLPGHGGILDRFDSLIVAAPVFCWAHKALT